jgi:hypothetical protein
MVRVVASSSKKNRSNLSLLVVVAVCTMLGGSLIRIYLYEQEHSHSSQLLSHTTTHTTKHAILNEFKTAGRKTTKQQQQQQQHHPPQHQEQQQKQQQRQQPEDEDDEEETEETEHKLTPESPVAAARLYPTLQCEEYGGPSELDAQEMVYWQGNNNIYIYGRFVSYSWSLAGHTFVANGHIFILSQYSCIVFGYSCLPFHFCCI